MKKLLVCLACVLLGTYSPVAFAKEEFKLPEQISLQEKSEDYLTDKQIDRVQTYQDAVDVVEKLGESLLEAMDDELEKLPANETAYYYGQRLGATIMIESIQTELDEAIEDSDFDFDDSIPKENRKQVIASLKEIRDVYVEQFEEFQSEIKEVIAETNSSTTDKTEDKSTSSEKAEEKSDETVSREFKNALRKAEQYLSFTAFSKEGLYGQLQFEGFPDDAARYAVDTISTDWKEQALKKAEDYLEFSSFSDQGLYDQLIFEKFTADEAQYAIDNLPD